MQKYLTPFVDSEGIETACSVRPDLMDEQEMDNFPDFCPIPAIYLAVRNVCVALWNLNVKVPVKIMMSTQCEFVYATIFCYI